MAKRAARSKSHRKKTYYLSSHKILAAIGDELKTIQSLLETADAQPKHLHPLNKKVRSHAAAKLKKLKKLQRVFADDYCCDLQAQNCEYDVVTGDGNDPPANG
jgi:hypothetical protein